MSRDELSLWMWSEACRLLERADTVQRQFAGIVGQSDAVVWEPPADVYETEWDLRIVLGLPGVAAGTVEMAVEQGQLVVRGNRELPAIPGRAGHDARAVQSENSRVCAHAESLPSSD